MARPSNTDERRAQITQALIKVMAKRGYDGASVADIAKAARLTPGLVHYHFQNKREILLAVLDDIVTRHDINLAQRLSQVGGEPLAQMAAFIDFHLGLGADADPEALACWNLVRGEALRDGQVRDVLEKALLSTIRAAARIIEQGVARRAFRCDSVEAAASALVAVIQGYFVLAATARAVIPPGSAAASAKRMVEGLLRPARPFPTAHGDRP
jgi:TetR/AcrR family transcriptional repressor of bet genes